MKETLRQRIGVDVGRRVSAEEAVEWAAQNEVYYFDIQTDIAPNALESLMIHFATKSGKAVNNTVCILGCIPYPE